MASTMEDSLLQESNLRPKWSPNPDALQSTMQDLLLYHTPEMKKNPKPTPSKPLFPHLQKLGENEVFFSLVRRGKKKKKEKKRLCRDMQNPPFSNACGPATSRELVQLDYLGVVLAAEVYDAVAGERSSPCRDCRLYRRSASSPAGCCRMGFAGLEILLEQSLAGLAWGWQRALPELQPWHCFAGFGLEVESCLRSLPTWSSGKYLPIA